MRLSLCLLLLSVCLLFLNRLNHDNDDKSVAGFSLNVSLGLSPLLLLLLIKKSSVN